MATHKQSGLSIKDLPQILNVLLPSISMRNVTYFGLNLNISQGIIEGFEKKYNGDMRDCLREILNERLKQEPPLTWHDIVTALRSPSVGEDRLACQIESQYMTHTQPPSSVPQHQGTQLSSVPQHQGTQLPSVPQHQGTQLSSVPQQQGTQLPSVPQHQGVQVSSVPQHQGVQVSTTHSGSSSQICLLVPSLLQSSTAVITSPLKAFIDYVKTIYWQSEVERDTSVVKWPPTPSKVYINLALIDRDSVSGRSREYDEVTEAMIRDGNVDAIVTITKGYIDFSKIAENISIPNSREKATSNERLILAEGAPGVGKSTFAREFCRRWERGEIAQQYQLVLLLRLREERISNAESLEDLIYHPSMEVCQTVKRELEFNLGVNTLIILEGFDELPDIARSGGSVFMDLIAGKLLPLATVLVTSRPWATQEIRLSYGNRISQHIEILGFTGRQITEYIESTLPQDKVSDLEAYLEGHPQIRAGMYIPLNSAIVVTVFEESQASGCAMPTTLTELYTSLTLTLLLRYLRGHPEYKNNCKSVHSFKDVPPPIYSKFSEVCKLAYNGTVGTRHQVQLIFRGLPSDFDDLGFMDSVTELYVTRGAVSSHNFLHLTFQEFFAAVHISNMSPAQQVEHFKRHKEGRMKVVLRFLAGLNKLNCFSIEDIAKNFFQTPSTREGSRYLISCDAAVGIDLVQWLFEAQSDDVIQHVLGQKTIEFELSSGMLPLDYYSLGYCISHSQCQWVLGLGKEGINKTGAKMLAAGAGTRTGSGRVVELKEGTVPFLANNLNMVVAESNSIISHQLSLKQSEKCDAEPITCSDLSALRVLELVISGKNILELNTLLPHLSLESLTIAAASNHCALVYEDCVAIRDHITSTTSLKELCLSSDILLSDKKGVEAITTGLARNQSLPLERLELECECTFTATAGDSLAQFITNTTTLKYLSIKEGNFDRVETITAALASNQSLPLERLELECECTFTATAGDSLAQFITNTTTLKYLSIKECTFSAHALLVLASAIHHNSILQTKNVQDFDLTVNGDNEAKDLAQLQLEYPDLMNKIRPYTTIVCPNNSISDAGAEALTQALHHNFTLTSLYLSNNSISDDGAVALAQALHHNFTLTSLNLSNNSISDDGAVALAQALDHNSTLTQLCLSNSISDAGAVALAQALHHNSTLTQLYLYNNSIGDAGAVALAQALRHNSTLTELDLSNNSISYAGAVALTQALHHNSTLTWLNLSRNSISEARAVDLGQALHHNPTMTLLV